MEICRDSMGGRRDYELMDFLWGYPVRMVGTPRGEGGIVAATWLTFIFVATEDGWHTYLWHRELGAAWFELAQGSF